MLQVINHFFHLYNFNDNFLLIYYFVVDFSDGKYKALVVELSLGSSSYATMALREILTHDTSSQTQAEQSAAYHTKDADQKKKEESSGDKEIQEKEVGKDEATEVEEKKTSNDKEAEVEKMDSVEVTEKEENKDDEKIKEDKVDDISATETNSPDVKIAQEKLQEVKMDETAESAVDATEK